MHKDKTEIVLETKIKIRFHAIDGSVLERMIVNCIYDDILSFVSGALYFG